MLNILLNYKNEKFVLVVSALGKTTNYLEDVLRNVYANKKYDLKKIIDFHYKIINNELRTNLKKSRDIMFNRLVSWNQVECSVPNAAFYAFFKVKGVKDSLEFSKKLILETNVGVAPRIAFGKSGEGHIRICFAAKESFINQIMDKLEPILNKS